MCNRSSFHLCLRISPPLQTESVDMIILYGFLSCSGQGLSSTAGLHHGHSRCGRRALPGTGSKKTSSDISVCPLEGRLVLAEIFVLAEGQQGEDV